MRPATLPPTLRTFFLCCIFAASVWGPARGQSPAVATVSPSSPATKIGLADYESQLDSYFKSASNLHRKAADIARFRESIPAQWSVRAGQADINVSNEWLRSELWNAERHPKDADAATKRIERRLAAMRKAAGQLDVQSPLPLAPGEHLDKIFQRKEFRGLAGPSELERLMARISQWLLEQVTRILKLFHINAKAGNFLAWTVIGIAFALLCYWIWTRLRTTARVSGEATDAPQLPAMSSREWLDEALAAAERGDYREAVHCAYWAAVARLEDSGLLARDRARTPRESLRQLASRPSEQKTLRDLTRHFELIWYGYRPASAADWSGARAQLEQMGCLKPSTAPTANS